MTEKQLQAAVLEAAWLLGWRCYHTWDSRRSQPGFPDLVLVRERVIFAELKSERGHLRKEQEEWLNALEHAGAEVHLWRPEHWVSGDVDACLAPVFSAPSAGASSSPEKGSVQVAGG